MTDLERILSNKIELVLLHESYDALDPNVVVSLVNEFSAGFDQVFERTRFEKAPNYYHFSSGDLTLEIDFVAEPVVEEAFTSALCSHELAEDFPQADEVVKQHQCYVHICIWNGQYEPADPITGEQPPLPSNFHGEGFDIAASILRFISAVQINHSRPTAVYWVQSDRLMRTPAFLGLAIDFKDQSLLVHPSGLSEEVGEDGRTIYGLRTTGASCLIGKELALSPVSIPPSELYQCALHFVSMTRGTGLLIPDGDVFGRSEAEIIRVHHLDDPQSGEPLVQLSIEYSEAHRIGQAPVAEEEEETVYEIDLDDPAEKAMHERIEAMKHAAVDAEPVPDAEVSEFEAELGGEPEWTGVQRKVDMSSLRSLTSASAKSEPDSAEEPAPKANIMGKVSGLFNRKQKG